MNFSDNGAKIGNLSETRKFYGELLHDGVTNRYPILFLGTDSV